MADLIYVAALDTKQILTALKNIDSNIDKMAKSADKNFQSVGKSAHASGVQIGTVSGVVSALTTEFIRLGERAISALIDIGKQSVQTAIEMDTLKARLGGIFDGSKAAADEAFIFIQQKSKELGIDLSELAGAFLPKTESLAQFERVAKIATALARSDPEQGAIGARIALIEALSGTFTSIQRRFEIPKDDIKLIKEAFDKEGIEGFLTALEGVLDRSGKSFEDLAGTAQASFNRVAIAGEQLGGRLGAPVVMELQKQFDTLFKTLTENEDDLILIADAFGRVLASIVEIIGTGINDFFANLDTEQAIELAETFFDIIENARTLAAVLGETDVPQALMDGISFIAEKLEEALMTAIKLTAIIQSEQARAAAIRESLAGSGEGRQALGVGRGRADVAIGLVSDEERAKAEAAGQEAANEKIKEALDLLEESSKRKESNREATDKLREALEKEADAGTGAADAILAAAQAQRELDESASAAEEAQTKINEAMAKAEKDLQRQLEDIDIQTERKRLDIQIEFAQKREDAARDNLEKLADIEKKNGQDIADAATDLSRKEEDIARKFADDRIDIERETRQKRVDIESDFRRKLQDIQTQFLLDADEAEQKRDAVGFLRALKRRDEEVRQAQQDRERTIQDTRVEEERKREELRIAQAREIEEARIANERKLEDLRLNLERQIEAQNTAYARQLDDLTIQEQRKNEELNRSRERDIEDAQRAYDRKLEDLKVSLEGEYKAIEEYETKKQDLLRQSWEAQYEIQKAGLDKMRSLLSEAALSAPVPAGTSRQPTRPGRRPTLGTGQGQGAHPGAIPGFQSGGGFTVGGSGGIDSQLVRFLASPGERVTISPPGSPVLMPTFGSGFGGNISNSRETNVNLPLATPEQIMNPILMAQIRNMIVRTIADVN